MPVRGRSSFFGAQVPLAFRGFGGSWIRLQVEKQSVLLQAGRRTAGVNSFDSDLAFLVRL